MNTKTQTAVDKLFKKMGETAEKKHNNECNNFLHVLKKLINKPISDSIAIHEFDLNMFNIGHGTKIHRHDCDFVHDFVEAHNASDSQIKLNLSAKSFPVKFIKTNIDWTNRQIHYEFKDTFEC